MGIEKFSFFQKMENSTFQDSNIIIQLTTETSNSANFPLLSVRAVERKTIPDIYWFMKTYFPKFKTLLEDNIPRGNYKVGGKVYGRFIKFDVTTGISETQHIWLSTNYFVLSENEGFGELMNFLASELNQLFQKWQCSQGSGWSFEKLLEFQIRMAKYRTSPRRGFAMVPPKLPAYIPKKSVVKLTRTVRTNIGDSCFHDAILIANLFAMKNMELIDFAAPVNSSRPMAWQSLIDQHCSSIQFPSNLISPEDKGVDTTLIYSFENANPNLFVLLLGINGQDVYAIRKFKASRYYAVMEKSRLGEIAKPRILCLLLYQEHYFPVTSLDLLMRLHKTHVRHYFCFMCLHPFTQKRLRDIHMKWCGTGGGGSNDTMNFVMPKPGSADASIDFSRFMHTCQKQPLVIYADIECYHEKSDAFIQAHEIDESLNEEVVTDPTEDFTKSRKNKTNTTITDVHKPYLAAYYIAINPEFMEILMSNTLIKTKELNQLFPELPRKLYQVFEGEDCINDFLKSLVDLVKRLGKLFQFYNAPMDLSEDEAMHLRGVLTSCVVCTKPLNFSITDLESNDKPVMDHCHWTGKFRGFAHNSCNLQVRQKRRFFPVVFHNFRGYDCHILLKHAHLLSLTDEEGNPVKISCIPTTIEKYLSLSLKWKSGEFTPRNSERSISLFTEIRFIDSLQFLNRSLCLLMAKLKDGVKCENDISRLFYHLRSTLCQMNKGHLIKLAMRKQVFPHDYITSIEVLNDTSLPPKQYFNKGLNSREEISDEEYAHALETWKETKALNIGEYSKFYLVVDVCGLADVYEKFRNDSIQAYGMDPIYYLSLPGFAWGAMFRKTQVKLDILTDHQMFVFYEQSIRGGLTQLTKHYQKADNVYTNPEKHVDENDKSRYLFLFDANGLYSWAMTQCLPVGGHKWIWDTEKLYNLFPVDNPNAWPHALGDKGYTLMVDLHTPKEIQDFTQSLPLAPAREEVGAEDFSFLMLNQYRDCNNTSTKLKTENKLLASQWDKEGYIVHFRLLRFFLQQGMKITKIHCAVEFDQYPFMANYINFNIQKRIEEGRTDETKSDFYKLLNNAVFGKTQEQQRKHMSLKLECDPLKQQLLVGKSNYRGSIIFTETLAAIFHAKSKTQLKHPIYVGSAILDQSKLLMYYFFYKVIKPLFNEVEVIYMDTDSFLLDINDDNVLKKLESIKDEWIDGSNMPENHPLYTTKNKGKLGKFKEELGGIPIEEVVALRPKMYCIKSQREEKKTAKGINKTVLKEQFRFEQYKAVFERSMREDENDTPTYIHQFNFRSRRHEVQTVRQRKKALTIADTKRYWISPNVSYPFGHYKTKVDLEATYPQRKEFLAQVFNQEMTQCTANRTIENLQQTTSLGKQRRPYKRPSELTRQKGGEEGASSVKKKKRQQDSLELETTYFRNEEETEEEVADSDDETNDDII